MRVKWRKMRGQTENVEIADVEQAAIPHGTTKIRRAKTFIAENKLYEQAEGFGLAVLSIVDMISDIVMR